MLQSNDIYFNKYLLFHLLYISNQAIMLMFPESRIDKNQTNKFIINC